MGICVSNKQSWLKKKKKKAADERSKLHMGQLFLLQKH